MLLAKYSFGIGDRFAHQASAQLAAFQQLSRLGPRVIPVWNKSNREHSLVGSEPASVQMAAEEAVRELGWYDQWHVDADHVQLATVDRYLNCSDFFTIDVADSIGKPSATTEIDDFISRHPELMGTFELTGFNKPYMIQREFVERVALKFLKACQTAGAIYNHIKAAKGSDSFIAEVSMDETDLPQTPPELMIILAALADAGVKLQTIAPKFTGRFNKGVDYVGDVHQFEVEFNEDIAVIAEAVKRYGLPENLKLSVHSGSDKFSLYPIIRQSIEQTGAGVHVKTAGTTWLEELIGLSEAGGDGLCLTKEIYAYAFEHVEELCAPYASVVDIQVRSLPHPHEVNQWDAAKLASTIRHIPNNASFNANVRQLLHVSFKLAAKAGSRFTDLLKANREIVGQNVTTNLLERHLKPVFLG
ncbi:MAG: hypothetical protein KF752_00385 [Pirellulaceae bacterium]|nr:hypothetical protein [Pirellulaceae bacterium]